jgi:phosphoenolpyruvate synthase/pyruvate phosphate dikinase
MTEVRVELPDELAAEIARRAAALGTTAEEWVAAMVQDVAADLPEETHEGPDDFIAR